MPCRCRGPTCSGCLSSRSSAGVLTNEEFQSKKTDRLASMLGGFRSCQWTTGRLCALGFSEGRLAAGSSGMIAVVVPAGAEPRLEAAPRPSS